VQGFLFGKALPPQALDELLAGRKPLQFAKWSEAKIAAS